MAIKPRSTSPITGNLFRKPCPNPKCDEGMLPDRRRCDTCGGDGIVMTALGWRVLNISLVLVFIIFVLGFLKPRDPAPAPAPMPEPLSYATFGLLSPVYQLVAPQDALLQDDEPPTDDTLTKVLAFLKDGYGDSVERILVFYLALFGAKHLFLAMLASVLTVIIISSIGAYLILVFMVLIFTKKTDGVLQVVLPFVALVVISEILLTFTIPGAFWIGSTVSGIAVTMFAIYQGIGFRVVHKATSVVNADGTRTASNETEVQMKSKNTPGW